MKRWDDYSRSVCGLTKVNASEMPCPGPNAELHDSGEGFVILPNALHGSGCGLGSKLECICYPFLLLHSTLIYFPTKHVFLYRSKRKDIKGVHFKIFVLKETDLLLDLVKL